MRAPVAGSTTSPRRIMRGVRSAGCAGRKIASRISNARGPDRRTIATAPRPGAVAGATMVSGRYIEEEFNCSETRGGFHTSFGIDTVAGAELLRLRSGQALHPLFKMRDGVYPEYS